MKKTSAVILLLFLTLFSLPLLVLLLASFVQENGSLTFLQYRAVFESEGTRSELRLKSRPNAAGSCAERPFPAISSSA